MSQYLEIFKQIGLAKNEALIYEALIREGELSVSAIAVKSKVHRRNVYDSLNRLLEKGLVFEIIQRREHIYQAVDPNKLMELLDLKRQALATAMPGLQELYRSTPHDQEVFVYRGIEGWKNYLRDILRVGEDFYCIGAKGAWRDPRVMDVFPGFISELEKKNISCFHLFDHEIKERQHEIMEFVGDNYKFFPKGYSAPASIDIFGSHVNLISDIKIGAMEQDFTFTVIVNPNIADAFRTWFKFMYDFCPE